MACRTDVRLVAFRPTKTVTPAGIPTTVSSIPQMLLTEFPTGDSAIGRGGVIPARSWGG